MIKRIILALFITALVASTVSATQQFADMASSGTRELAQDVNENNDTELYARALARGKAWNILEDYDLGDISTSGTSVYISLQNSNIGNLVSDGVWWTEVSGGGGLDNVVEDTTPQLGGNLDVQGFNIEGVDATEFGYVDGVTEEIQTALDTIPTVVTDLSGTNWRVFYVNGSGVTTELILGAAGTFLESNGPALAPSFGTPAGGGDLLAANNLSDVGIAATAYANIKQAATTSATGAVEQATSTEVVTGTATETYVTPDTLTDKMAAPGEIGGTTPGDVSATAYNLSQTSSGPQLTIMREDSDNGTNYVGIGSPTANANDLVLLLPSSDPSTGELLTCATPSSVTFFDGVARDASVCDWASASGETNSLETTITGIADTEIFIGDGADSGSFAVVSGDVTMANTGAVTIAANAVESSMIADTAIYTATASKSGAYTIGTDDGKESYGGVIYVTSAVTMTMPAVASGMSYTVVTIGAISVSLDTNASDRMYLDGVALDDGDKATNTSTTGDIITCTYESASGWYCASGSPDGDHWTDGGA